MHCGSAYAGARYWAKGSCIQFGLQILFIIIIVIVVVVTAGAAVATGLSALTKCTTLNCATGIAGNAASCMKQAGSLGGTKATCEAISGCKWTAGMSIGSTTMPGTCF
jgi:hypothetical protein